jgi:hypothetical protein
MVDADNESAIGEFTTLSNNPQEQIFFFQYYKEVI